MIRRRTTIVRGRREVLRLAALGLGSLAAACGRTAEKQPSRTEGGAGTRPTVRASSAAGTRAPSGTAAAIGGEPQCLVTKTAGLPPGYVPSDLTPLPGRLLASDGVRMRRAAADAVVSLIDGAGRDGQELFVLSGFRSYQEQEQVLREEIKLYGQKVAEQQVAPPGKSEHQLGLAADITSKRDPYTLRAAFGQEPEGKWLAANAPRFGFVISYPLGKDTVTGYTYEPWHIRYVGTPLAEQVAASGLTLTEFLPRNNLAGGCP